MTTRTASCRCGQLKATVTGEPVRVSVCHCLACQKRTGSVFSAQARWPVDQVTIKGQSKSWTRTADSGRTITYNFCPECGSTVHYTGGNFPDVLAIALGLFDDPYFGRPRFSVWEKRKHDWVEISGDIEHSD
ncbi:MAG TPA: GFA family protein [Sphingomicrobium sp.]